MGEWGLGSTLPVMRRIWASLLVTVFSITLISPAVSASAEPKLPLCCRSNGKHRCAITESRSGPSGPLAQAGRCSTFSADQTIPPHQTVWAARHSAAIYGVVLSRRTPRPQTQSLSRILFDPSSQKRGPPFLT